VGTAIGGFRVDTLYLWKLGVRNWIFVAHECVCGVSSGISVISCLKLGVEQLVIELTSSS